MTLRARIARIARIGLAWARPTFDQKAKGVVWFDARRGNPFKQRQPYRINSDIAWKMRKNQQTNKKILMMRKNAAEVFRRPGVFPEARSKQAPTIKDRTPIVNATTKLLLSKANLIGRVELMDCCAFN